jgi:hypothetical protein
MFADVATQIIKDSIKSVVYIDENAREAFQPKTVGVVIDEENKSEELFQNFKDSGISLSVHKFTPSDITNVSLKNYLFEGRDLVLLDWRLAGESGEDYALNLLSDIVQRSHIHFCSIYTSVENKDNVFENILSYFSQSTEQEYDEIKLQLAGYEDDIIRLRPEIKAISFNRFDKLSGKLFETLFRANTDLVNHIHSIVKEANNKLSLIKASIAFDITCKSAIQLVCPTSISHRQYLLVINSTIITIINKAETQPSQIINTFSEQVYSSTDSFTKLLGVEMQNIFSKSGAFIDPQSISISKNALLHHRKEIKDDPETIDYHDEIFNDTVKKILIEHANQKLKPESLSLLSSAVLDELTAAASKPSDNELLGLNTFYNSIKLDGSNKRLDFGDVFVSGSDYYLCITALCDCIRPSKNKWQFYFIKGSSITPSKALILGDTAFVSYVSTEKIINWTTVESIDMEEENPLYREMLDSFRYKPVYSKPLQFLVAKPEIINGEISMWKTIQDSLDKADIQYLNLKYITTIKENYTQRIANHAFTHSVRIGVNFVKQ